MRFKSRIVLLIVAMIVPVLVTGQANDWIPPERISREDIVKTSKQVLARPDLALKVSEDIVRVNTLGLDWDTAGRVYTPADESKIPTGPDGRKLGAILIHGGSGDHRFMDDVASVMAKKFGFKVVTLSLPGRYYMDDPSGNWPGDTINADGTVRTPMWKKGEYFDAAQYDVVTDESVRPKYGTLYMACAKQGSVFHARMSGWPVAFEEGSRAFAAKHLPASEFSIYVHGRSTGGPFSFLLTQRVPNVVGVIGMENTPFGYIFREQARESGNSEGMTIGDVVPFNCLQVRTWRDAARMLGPEAGINEGVEALYRLPMLIEEVMEEWKLEAKYPGFKAEMMVHFAAKEPLEAAARATAQRLGLNQVDTDKLVKRYLDYCCELRGSNVKPVPPIIFGIAAASPDHESESYKNHTVPMFREMSPAPKVHLVEFGAGVHFYAKPERDLPVGLAPAVVQLWYDGIMHGYYEAYARKWGAMPAN